MCVRVESVLSGRKVENVEYEERESEYDLDDEDKSIKKSVDNDDEVDVDVMTIQPMQAFLSRLISSFFYKKNSKCLKLKFLLII